MTVLIVALGFLALLIVGFISLLRDLGVLVEKHNFLTEFRNRFVKFAIAYFDDQKLEDKEYQWLLENVDEASSTLGGADAMTYRPPFANYIVNNYQLLINLIPSFNTSMGAHRDDATSAESILTRFTGQLNKYIKRSRKELRNPVNWLVEGVAVVLSVPLLLLSKFGILSKSIYGKIRSSRFLRFIAGVISLISMIDAVYVIVTKSSFTVELVKQLLDVVLK